MTWYLPEPLTWCSVDLGSLLACAPWTGNIDLYGYPEHKYMILLGGHMTPPNPPFWESSHHIEHMFWLATSKHRQHWKKQKKHLTIHVSTWNKTPVVHCLVLQSEIWVQVQFFFFFFFFLASLPLAMFLLQVRQFNLMPLKWVIALAGTYGHGQCMDPTFCTHTRIDHR